MAKSKKKRADIPGLDAVIDGLEAAVGGLDAPAERLEAPAAGLAEEPCLLLDGQDITPDPWRDVQYTGDRAVDAKAEMSATLKAFAARAKEEKQRFRDATDSEYWFCVCFQTRAQKEAFLKAMKWLAHGDKYLDGTAVAEREGIELPDADLRFVESKHDRVLTELSLPLD